MARHYIDGDFWLATPEVVASIGQSIKQRFARLWSTLAYARTVVYCEVTAAILAPDMKLLTTAGERDPTGKFYNPRSA
jgi:hypothetical protein